MFCLCELHTVFVSEISMRYLSQKVKQNYAPIILDAIFPDCIIRVITVKASNIVPTLPAAVPDVNAIDDTRLYPTMIARHTQ